MTFRNGLLIGFITEGLPFHGRTLEETSLGGSETAVICLARELARRGNEVHVFCRCPQPGVVPVSQDPDQGVAYYDLEAWKSLAGVLEFDVLVVSRYYPILETKFKARLTVLWNHDICTNPGDLIGKLWQTDLVFCLSKFHVKDYLDKAPDLRPLMHQTRNGVDWAELAQHQGTPKIPGKFLYPARPERGLEFLATKVMPLLVKEIPGATLHLCGYDVLPSKLPEETQAYYRTLNEALDQYPWIVRLGSLKRADYYRELASSQMVLYPTSFPEISCINALEAQGIGTPILTTDDFALKETVGPKTCLIPLGPNYEQRFAQRVIGLLRDARSYTRIVQQGQEWVKSHYQWADIAADWESLFYRMFETRYHSHREGICRRLMYNSDYVVARDVAEREGLPEILEELNALEIGGVEKYVPWENEVEATGQTYEQNRRWHWVVERLTEQFQDRPFTLLDIGSSVGSLATFVVNRMPHARVIGLDWSPEYIQASRAFRERYAKDPSRLDFLQGDPLKEHLYVSQLGEGCKADAVFMGEVLEHHADYQKTLEAVESYVKPGGLILLTFPSGPTESLSYRRSGSLRLHIRHFEFRDVQEIFAKRTGFDFKLLPWTVSHLDASLIGMWLVRYVKTPGQPVGEIDLERKVTTARPYNRISVCLITKDEEESIVRCLKSVRDVADEIILADTGSTDQTLRLAEPYVDRILSLPASPEGDGLGNFSAWRNASIAPAKGEWILWIDADETLVEASHVRRYLEGPLFNAFVLKQRHMMLDFVAPDDTPMRLFRNHRGYQFFGVIHEHVEEAMDVQISPALVHPHSYVAHYGYLNEKIRRAKCRERNLPLLKKDLQMNPHRLLSKVLAARDYINFMHWAQEAHNTPMNEEVKRWALEACTIHRSYFTDPRGPHFRISFKNYQTALEALGKAGVPVTEDGRPPFEIGLLLLGGLGGITQRNPMEPQFVWCWDRSEAEEFFARQTARLLARLEGAASAVA